jgi:hypothetical protein
MERVKEFKHYLVHVKLLEGGYWMKHYTAEKFDTLASVRVRDNRYVFQKSLVYSLHGWYPWLKENRWNAWRQVYNMLYRYFIAAGFLYFEEQKPIDGKFLSIAPTTWVAGGVKWTPALVQAVNLSKKEQEYNRRLRPAFSSLSMNWKTMLIIGVVIVVALLFLTGRIPL